MNVKTDTKEKFTVFTPQIENFTANMTDELGNLLLNTLHTHPPHVILNLKEVKDMDEETVKAIADWQIKFYENNCSFVVCEMTNEVKTVVNNLDLLDIMNITPTESEAWDMVQMEEIERELFD